MILGKDSRKRWTEEDIVLAEAYQILENERCSQCGLPRYICQNESNDILFEMHEQTCYATQKREDYEKRQEAARKRTKRGKSSPDEAPSGVVVSPSPYRQSGEPLIALREAFYEDESKKTQARLAGRPKPPVQN